MKLYTSHSEAIEETKVNDVIEVVEPYITKLQKMLNKPDQTTPEEVLSVPSDKKSREHIKAVLEDKITDKLKVVFLVGIGGSNLGTLAVCEAVRGRYNETSPKLISLDAVSAEDIEHLQKKYTDLNPEEYLVFVVSKSGSTVETVVNTELSVKQLCNDKEQIKDRMVVISDENSELYKFAQTENIAALSLPKAIGGRFSVFTSVGLAPLHALGIDIDQLCEGAAAAVVEETNKDLLQNQALLSAAYIFKYSQKGYTVRDSFYFSNSFEGVGKWYRQLFAESLGKAKNRYDETIHAGLVPTVSVGSTDLHSVGQLYMSGPATIFTSFVFVAPQVEYSVPSERFLTGLLPYLSGKTSTEISQAIEKGVLDAYNDRNRPFLVEKIPEASPYEIGKYMQYKIIEVMYLAVLLEVNPFDQPGVESYKSHTREYLQSTTDE